MLFNLSRDALSGLLLILMAVIALVWDNSAFAPLYDSLLNAQGIVSIGAFGLSKPLLLWINEGLMAIFFLLIGLEIKKEVQSGSLSDPKDLPLPLLAAIGGMAVPAIIYTSFNIDNSLALNGWAIPTATDIAFAVGILALAANRAPTSLKVFLLTVAIIDDLGAVIIIAAFYTADLSLVSLSLGIAGCFGLFLLNRFGIRNTSAYLMLGAFIWVCVLKSGVHATLAGVAVGLAIPGDKKYDHESPLSALEHNLHYPVAFIILPLFALANAGVALGNIPSDILYQPVALGVALGLMIGKPLGILGGAYIATSLLKAELPEKMNMRHVWGISHLSGIGFTMSLFIGALAFDSDTLTSQVRIAILVASLLSAIIGSLIIRSTITKVETPPEVNTP